MENLNAEQIKKALQCFHQRILDTHLADDIREGEMMAILDALALINLQEQRIKELAEKNERLRVDNEIKSQKRANIFEITNAFDRGRTDGVRKMQERLKAKAMGFPNYIGEVIAARWVDQIAKEMLEVAQRPEVLNDQSSGLSDPEGDRLERREE